MATHTQPRIHAKQDDLIPRIMVRIMFGLVFTVLVIVSVATLTGRAPDSQPPAGNVLSERAIYLSGDASGAARVLDANGVVLADLAADQGGFVAGAQRDISQKERCIDGPVDLRDAA